MKKLSLLVMLIPTLLASCSRTTPTSSTTTNAVKTSLDETAAAAAKMSTAELLEKAKTEKGDFNCYGNTSRIAAAVTNFITKYGTDLGLTEKNAAGTKLGDADIFTKLSSEYNANDNSKGASFVLIQDSAQLETYRENTEILTNYVSDEFKSDVHSDDLVPLAHQFINKLFIWNKTGGESAPAFKNVWELTEAKYKNKIYFKSPATEQVNMNFLITLTSPAWVTKMNDSYKAYFKKDFVATDDTPNASYQWIKGFLTNADITSYTSDTKMAAGVSDATNADKVGLFVLSKLRDKSVTTDNLQVGCWTQDSITPFAGFMYSIYAQIATKAPRPYTAMLFTNYLMTEEGFAPWKTAVGGYSANTKVKEYEGDKSLDFYKQNLVIEDGAYIKEHKVDVSDFINKLISK